MWELSLYHQLSLSLININGFWTIYPIPAATSPAMSPSAMSPSANSSTSCMCHWPMTLRTPMASALQRHCQGLPLQQATRHQQLSRAGNLSTEHSLLSRRIDNVDSRLLDPATTQWHDIELLHFWGHFQSYNSCFDCETFCLPQTRENIHDFHGWLCDCDNITVIARSSLFMIFIQDSFFARTSFI